MELLEAQNNERVQRRLTKRKREEKILKVWHEFIQTEILPKKCEVVSSLLAIASKGDLVKIEKLRTEFDKTINLIMRRRKTLDSTTRSLKFEITKIAINYIDPKSRRLGDDFDLDKNIFRSIRFNHKHLERIEQIRQRAIDFHIEIEEALFPQPMVTLIGKRQSVYEFEDLYSILLLDEKPQSNIDKMKMRLITHGITP